MKLFSEFINEGKKKYSDVNKKKLIEASYNIIDNSFPEKSYDLDSNFVLKTVRESLELLYNNAYEEGFDNGYEEGYEDGYTDATNKTNERIIRK